MNPPSDSGQPSDSPQPQGEPAQPQGEPAQPLPGESALPLPPPAPPAPGPARRTPIGMIIGCGCLAAVVVITIGVVGFLFFVGGMLKNNEPYREALAAVQSDPAAIEALGEPIKPGFIPTGSVSINNGDGDVSLNFKVSGPEGRGIVVLEGERSGGVWTYEVRELRVEGREDPIPLE